LCFCKKQKNVASDGDQDMPYERQPLRSLRSLRLQAPALDRSGEGDKKMLAQKGTDVIVLSRD
jgi:hypothetical protein